jgi:hypothetical protein
MCRDDNVADAEGHVLEATAVTQLTIFVYRMNEVPVTAGAWTVSVRAADGVLADTTPIGP